MPDQRDEYFGSLLHYSKQCISRRPLLCTGTLQPHHGPPDSCMHAEIKALQTCCEDIKALGQWSHGGPSGVDCTSWDVLRTATVWMRSQRLWRHTSASVRTAVYHHAPGWVITVTNPGSQLSSDSYDWKRKEHSGVGKGAGLKSQTIGIARGEKC